MIKVSLNASYFEELVGELCANYSTSSLIHLTDFKLKHGQLGISIMALVTNYNLNKYLAVMFERGSEYIDHPSNLATLIPALEYVGQIGNIES